MEHQETAGHGEHPPTTIRQYIMIGIVLAILTVIELALTEAVDLPFVPLVVSLVVLSGIKFAIVVALFMHLRFDNQLLTRLFVFGFVLAAVLLVSMLALFVYDHRENDIVAGRGEGAGLVSHGGEPAAGHGGEATATPEATGEAGAAGDLLVSGLPAGEYFGNNCAVCHGQNREGLVGPALTPDVLTQPDDVYHDAIKNGRPGTAMPPWGNALTDEDITHLVQFLKTVQP